MDNCVQVCVYVFMRVRSQIYHAWTFLYSQTYRA
jgi:hypothetical protein